MHKKHKKRGKNKKTYKNTSHGAYIVHNRASQWSTSPSYAQWWAKVN